MTAVHTTMQDHKELGLKGCATKLGVSRTALGVWTKEAKVNNDEVSTRGSGNYESDESIVDTVNRMLEETR